MPGVSSQDRHPRIIQNRKELCPPPPPKDLEDHEPKRLELTNPGIDHRYPTEGAKHPAIKGQARHLTEQTHGVQLKHTPSCSGRSRRWSN